MRRLVAVLTVVAGVLAAGCSGGSGGAGGADAGGEDGPEVPLQGTLRRATLFDTQHAFSLTLEPSGDRDLQLGTIQLRSPLFERVAAQPRDTVVRASERAIVMPLRYGEARCDAEADAAAEAGGPAELVAEVDGDEVRLPLGEVPEDMLAELHARECAVAEVLAAVDVRFGDRWERVGPRAVGTDLELVQRRAGVDAAVVEFAGNVVFTAEPGDPGLAVGDGRRSDRASVVIDASRCDPHALIEYKRKFILTARVRVGDDEPVVVDVRAVGPGQRALEALLAACLD